MQRFHHTVQHWSRLREFAADAAGARVTSADAASRALLRTAAVETRTDETLYAFFQTMQIWSAPSCAVLRHVVARGVDNPVTRLEERQPHLTNSHPPMRQRLVALVREPGPASLAEAVIPAAAGCGVPPVQPVR
jgi:Zn-dependent protease with chaperone function